MSVWTCLLICTNLGYILANKHKKLPKLSHYPNLATVGEGKTSCSILPSLMNKTQRYLTASTWGRIPSLTWRMHSFSAENHTLRFGGSAPWPRWSLRTKALKPDIQRVDGPDQWLRMLPENPPRDFPSDTIDSSSPQNTLVASSRTLLRLYSWSTVPQPGQKQHYPS